MYDPYSYLPEHFARAVQQGRLHVYCEFCARRRKTSCLALTDPVSIWERGECWAYTEKPRDVLLAEKAVREYALRKRRFLLARA